MNDVAILVEVLREWPGSTDRLQRLWWSKRQDWYRRHAEGPPDPLTDEEINAFLRAWAHAFLAQPMEQMTGPELEVMFQLRERCMLEMEDDGETDLRLASGLSAVEFHIAHLGKPKARRRRRVFDED